MIIGKSGSLNHLEPSEPVIGLYRECFIFYILQDAGWVDFFLSGWCCSQHVWRYVTGGCEEKSDDYQFAVRVCKCYAVGKNDMVYLQ